MGLKNPISSASCCRPESPPPFKTKKIRLKQADPQDLSGQWRSALRFFSGYFERWKHEKKSNVESSKQALMSLSPDVEAYEFRSEEMANRRFAGDWLLPRSRYFSLCHSGSDSDDGTMKRELLAYQEPLSSGWIEIDDQVDSCNTEVHTDSSLEVASEPRTRTGINISIPPFTASRHPWLLDLIAPRSTAKLVLPVRVKEVEFKRVIDLRVPTVSTWFAKNLTRLRWINESGEMSPAFPLKPPLDYIDALLPSLATQTLGGGHGATRIAGLWLRALGADALVFPSARSDASVEIRDGHVIDSYGWNLVDFRGTTPPRLLIFDMTKNWLSHIAEEIDDPQLPLYGEVKLRRVLDGIGAGSWSWSGIEEARSALRWAHKALFLYQWAMGEVDYEPLFRYLAFEGTQTAIAGSFETLFRAFFGNDKLRRAILGAIDDCYGEGTSEVLRLPLAFTCFDKRRASL
jgi:hypothetical protein